MKLEVKKLTKNYGKKEVLKDINFTFEEGKIYGLIGRNGSGKTTFFNCLNKDVEINQGQFYLDQETLNPEDIGYVTATPIVPEFLTGKEFLKFFKNRVFLLCPLFVLSQDNFGEFLTIISGIIKL